MSASLLNPAFDLLVIAPAFLTSLLGLYAWSESGKALRAASRRARKAGRAL